MAKEFLEYNKANLFLETSAKTGFNAQNVFIEAAKLLYEQHLHYKDRISRPDSITNLNNENNSKKIMDTEFEEDENTSKNRRKKGCC